MTITTIKSMGAVALCALAILTGCQSEGRQQKGESVPPFAAPNILVATESGHDAIDVSAWVSVGATGAYLSEVTAVSSNSAQCGEPLTTGTLQFTREQSTSVSCQYDYTLRAYGADEAGNVSRQNAMQQQQGRVTTFVSSSTIPTVSPQSIVLGVGKQDTVSVALSGYHLEPDITSMGAVDVVASDVVQQTITLEGTTMGSGQVHYLLASDANPDERKFGVIYVTVIGDEASELSASNFAVPDDTAHTQVFPSRVITIDVKAFVATSTPETLQLVSVDSLTSMVVPSDENDFTNTSFTFTATTEGDHIVSYVVSDQQGYFDAGLLTVTVSRDPFVLESSRIVGNRRAFAAIADDDTIKVWGDDIAGGNQSDVTEVTDVKAIHSNLLSFAAVYGDENRVWVWGHDSYGGNQSDVVELKDVKAIVSSDTGYAVVYGDENRVKTWGNYVSQNDVNGLRDVKAIYSTQRAFAAVYGEENKVWVWGTNIFGGNQSDVAGLEDVKAVYSTTRAFAAVYGDENKVRAWGGNEYGGNQNDVSALSDVKDIYSAGEAFAAVYGDENRVWAWGNDFYGGNQSQVSELKDVKTISSTHAAFAAIYGDENRVWAWGLNSYGGNQSHVESFTGVTAIYSNEGAFAATYGNENKVKAWGQNSYGGIQSDVDSLTGVIAIYSTTGVTAGAFAAVYGDENRVQAWGDPSSGGSPSDVVGLSAVNGVFPNAYAFAATNWEDGSVAVWGSSHYGGDQDDVDALNFTVTLR